MESYDRTRQKAIMIISNKGESMDPKELSVIVKQCLQDNPNGVSPEAKLALDRQVEAYFKTHPELFDFGDAYGQINDGFEKFIGQ
jgi:hypothetical protein